jgi:hypothetical protein
VKKAFIRSGRYEGYRVIGTLGGMTATSSTSKRTNSEGKLPDEAPLIVVDRLQDCCLGLSGDQRTAL